MVCQMAYILEQRRSNVPLNTVFDILSIMVGVNTEHRLWLLLRYRPALLQRKLTTCREKPAMVRKLRLDRRNLLPISGSLFLKNKSSSINSSKVSKSNIININNINRIRHFSTIKVLVTQLSKRQKLSIVNKIFIVITQRRLKHVATYESAKISTACTNKGINYP